jgi:hypothetical protein
MQSRLRPPVGRFSAFCALALLVAGCQSGSHPVFSPAPSPSPHSTATAAILQPADVPAGLTPCLGSGPIDVYVAALAQTDQALATRVGAQWEALRVAGATEGAISVFTANPAACNADLGATPTFKSISGFVAVFADPGEADRAWAAGIFGFVPPAPGENLIGSVRGAATGLGLSSWTYVHLPVRLASWHRSVFVVLIVGSNLDPNAFKAATAAVDARLD